MVTLTSRFVCHVTFRRREPPLARSRSLTAIGADPPIRRGTLERHRTPLRRRDRDLVGTRRWSVPQHRRVNRRLGYIARSSHTSHVTTLSTISDRRATNFTERVATNATTKVSKLLIP
jgi:hypothetical protein